MRAKRERRALFKSIIDSLIRKQPQTDLAK